MRLYTPGKFNELGLAILIFGLFIYGVSVVDRTAERNADGNLEIGTKEEIVDQIKEDAADAEAALKEAIENAEPLDYSKMND